MDANKEISPTVYGKLLQKARKEKGWSLQEVEKMTGIKGSYIHLLEIGKKRNPSVTTIFALTNVYNLEMCKVAEMVVRQAQEDEISDK
ncbi:helix-turn-helix domain-containing protein [Radiobacillus deserti]|uniref:Helix-turn-helix transcriptional regulator n=1 Tax=Radiobacillus deserti TaxID=2594883 RepID=A0A516KD74_9BACI|nr:helix-turn-helix transcriptional regulator [Radiobacillus deserti]QDP39364.1 helix-turn-helix transcriptional regulator [Radiobacillus deserti]